jgi:pilus assembly protein CpaC
MPSFRQIFWSAITGVVLFNLPLLAEEQQTPKPVAGPVVANQAPGVPANATDTQEVHILSGRSVIINLQSRLRRVLVSNPTVIHSETTSPTQLVMVARETGSSSVIIWDETGHSRILDVYSDVDVASLRAALQQAYPNESIEVTADQGNIVLAGVVPTKGAFEDIGKIASSYSKTVVNSLTVAERHGKQILLSVKFAEVDRSKLEQYGINFFSTGAANTPGTVSTQQFAPPTTGGTLTNTIPGSNTGFKTSFNFSDLLNIFLFRPDINLGATIKDLQQKNVLQILAEPNLMAMNGQPAKFLAGGEFPYPVVQTGATFNTVTITFRPFGVQLNFVAYIESDDVIRLKVAPEVSALDFSNALTISGFTIPALSTRRAESEIELKNGQSFGIAGMLDHRTTAVLNKLPGIGDVPVLGKLFRSKSFNNTSTELIVLVTPTIVDPVGEAGGPPRLPVYPMPLLEEPKFDESVGKKPKASDNASPSANPK